MPPISCRLAESLFEFQMVLLNLVLAVVDANEEFANELDEEADEEDFDCALATDR